MVANKKLVKHVGGALDSVEIQALIGKAVKKGDLKFEYAGKVPSKSMA